MPDESGNRRAPRADDPLEERKKNENARRSIFTLKKNCLPACFYVSRSRAVIRGSPVTRGFSPPSTHSGISRSRPPCPAAPHSDDGTLLLPSARAASKTVFFSPRASSSRGRRNGSGSVSGSAATRVGFTRSSRASRSFVTSRNDVSRIAERVPVGATEGSALRESAGTDENDALFGASRIDADIAIARRVHSSSCCSKDASRASSLVVMVVMKHGSSSFEVCRPSVVCPSARARRSAPPSPETNGRTAPIPSVAKDRDPRTAAKNVAASRSSRTPRTSRRSSRVKLGRSLGNSASRANAGAYRARPCRSRNASQLAPPPAEIDDGSVSACVSAFGSARLGGRSCRTPRVSRGDTLVPPSSALTTQASACVSRSGSVHDERSSPHTGHAHVLRLGTPSSPLASVTSPPAPSASWTHDPQPAGGVIPAVGEIVSRRMRPSRESARATLPDPRASNGSSLKRLFKA